MKTRGQQRRGRCVCGLVVLFGGCGVDLGMFSGAGPVTDGNQDGTLTSAIGKTFGEPNGSFFNPVIAVFQQDVANLQGTISDARDLDVYHLGSLDAGDRVIVDVATPRSSLDVSIALFDDGHRLVVTNDDRGGTDPLDSYVDFTVRHAAAPYFLVVTRAALASPGTEYGSYTVRIDRRTGGDVPPPIEQTLLLDFSGGILETPALGTTFLEPFDAADISPIYAGETEPLKEAIRAVFEENFAGFGVTIATSDDPPLPDGVGRSIISFGGFNSRAFGISQNVDLYNAEFCDDAVIFTQSFAPQAFMTVPGVEELAVAIGNVGSHEAGHLLGLNHVDLDIALMDDRSASDALLEDQDFMEAPLSRDVMEIGTQDAVLLLGETVGFTDPSPVTRPTALLPPITSIQHSE